MLTHLHTCTHGWNRPAGRRRVLPAWKISRPAVGQANGRAKRVEKPSPLRIDLKVLITLLRLPPPEGFSRKRETHSSVLLVYYQRRYCAAPMHMEVVCCCVAPSRANQPTAPALREQHKCIMIALVCRRVAARVCADVPTAPPITRPIRVLPAMHIVTIHRS